MMACPRCKGKGFFASHAEGKLSEDCEICADAGEVFSGMHVIPRFFFAPKYVIICLSCARENHFRDAKCFNCGHRFS